MDPNPLLHDYAVEAETLLRSSYNEIRILRNDNTDSDAKEKLSRCFHSLKGGASFFELDEIMHVCHTAETHVTNIDKLSKEEASAKLDLLTNSISDLLRKFNVISFDEKGFDGRAEDGSTQLSKVLSTLPALAKSIAAQLNKEVDVVILHNDIQLPKRIVDALLDPLVHLVRNSVDHGIEPSRKRQALKKTSVGKILLDCTFENDILTIVFEDDGQGLDEDKIRLKAVQKRMMNQDKAASLLKDELWQMVFLPGFSTSESVTEISGRGIGMDVVKNTVQKLGGSIRLSSEKQKGLKIVITLPIEESTNG